MDYHLVIIHQNGVTTHEYLPTMQDVCNVIAIHSRSQFAPEPGADIITFQLIYNK